MLLHYNIEYFLFWIIYFFNTHKEKILYILPSIYRGNENEGSTQANNCDPKFFRIRVGNFLGLQFLNLDLVVGWFVPLFFLICLFSLWSQNLLRSISGFWPALCHNGTLYRYRGTGRVRYLKSNPAKLLEDYRHCGYVNPRWLFIITLANATSGGMFNPHYIPFEFNFERLLEAYPRHKCKQLCETVLESAWFKLSFNFILCFSYCFLCYFIFFCALLLYPLLRGG